MIIEEFLTLPAYIDFEGAAFELQIFINGSSEARIGYILHSVGVDSPHKAIYDKYGSWYNKLADADDPPLQSFLRLYEGIETDADLVWAIRQLWYWVQDKGFLH